MKDWKTTVGGVVGALLIVLGMFWPDKVDPETQATINTAVAGLLSSLGTLIAALTLIFSKDSDNPS